MNFKPVLILAIVLTLTNATFAQKPDAVKTEPVKSDPVKAAKLPTVQEILAKYVKAIGGREANEKIKSRMMAGTVEFAPMGLKGTFETYTAPEAKSLTKMNIAGIGEMLEGLDGTTAWAVNPIQGSRDKTGAELAQAKMLANFYREVNLEKSFSKLELKGIEKVGDKDAYVIVASADGSATETWYFDTLSGMLLRTDMNIVSPEGVRPAKVFYEEMRTADGVTVPVKIRTQIPGMEVIMTATELKHGVPLDDSKFAKPKQ